MKENVHFIFGGDDYFVDLRAKKILEEYKSLPIEIVDGAMSTIADMTKILGEVAESLRTMDFFSSQKCVWLRSTNLLESGSPATTEGGQSIVERWVEQIQKLPEEVIFIISASPVDKRTRLFKTLQSLAVCEEMEDKKSADYLVFLTQKCCQSCHLSITEDAMSLLHQKMSCQPRAIANEIEKLACIKGFSGEINVNDVLKNTPTLLNDEFFEPVEAFYSKDEVRYIKSLRTHFILNKEMRSVLSMMQNRNRILLQLAELKLPSVSKNSLEQCYASAYDKIFGPVKEKNSFCVFSQNPWYLGRLKILFSVKTLLQLQKAFVDIFDKILQQPQQACYYMESLVSYLKVTDDFS